MSSAEQNSGAAGNRAPVSVDPSLLRRAQAGDFIALNEILRVVEPYVGRICGSIALDEGADAAQETLIIIFRHLRDLRDGQAFIGWVRTIAVRESIRIAHRRPLSADVIDIADVQKDSDPKHGWMYEGPSIGCHPNIGPSSS